MPQARKSKFVHMYLGFMISTSETFMIFEISFWIQTGVIAKTQKTRETKFGSTLTCDPDTLTTDL